MQGNIIVTTNSGENTFPFNQENLTSLIDQVSEQNIPITKLVFQHVNTPTSDIISLIDSMKENRFITELAFDDCNLETELIKKEISKLVYVPLESLNTNQPIKTNTSNQDSSTTPSDPIKIMTDIMLSRNHTLKQVRFNGEEINNIGLEVNKSLEPWDPTDASIDNLHRFFASYYLSLAIQLAKHKQTEDAIEYASYGQLTLKRISTLAENQQDRRNAVKCSMFLGDLYAQKSMLDSSKIQLLEAENKEQNTPERERKDDNWRNLLIIDTSIANLTNQQKSIDKSARAYRAISALISFFQITQKTPTDFQHATSAAKILSTLPGTATAFIYHSLFDEPGSTYNIDDKANEALSEMRMTQNDKLHDLYVKFLIFVNNDKNLASPSSQPIKKFMQTTNKHIFQNALIDIINQEKPANASSPLLVPDDNENKNSLLSYYARLFTTQVNSQKTQHDASPDRCTKPVYA